MMHPEPSPENAFLAEHARLLWDSHRRLTGRPLLPDADPRDPVAIAGALYHAPFVLLSHDTAADPLFNYANLTAQRLFELAWGEFVGMPSRYSAEPLARAERERLLARVASHGYIDDYSGVRVARSGRRFLIRAATVWNLLDDAGTLRGQAAMFACWEDLPSGSQGGRLSK